MTLAYHALELRTIFPSDMTVCVTCYEKRSGRKEGIEWEKRQFTIVVSQCYKVLGLTVLCLGSGRVRVKIKEEQLTEKG